MKKFKRGTKVIKILGDSNPTGTVLGTVKTSQGKFRVIVELDFANLLHIYSPEQLDRL
jgi:hypothetical protein